MSETTTDVTTPRKAGWNTEDWWACAVGLGLFAISCLAVLAVQPAREEVTKRLEQLATAERAFDAARAATDPDPSTVKAAEEALKTAKKQLAKNPLAVWLGKTSEWRDDPRAAFFDKQGRLQLLGLAVTFAALGAVFALGAWSLGRPLGKFLPGFVGMASLALLAQVMADQAVIKHFNLEYALWALVVGLVISNTIGTPGYLLSAAWTEFYIKTGLVLLGGEVLFHRLLTLGLPGVCVSWVVTPVVLITTYAFGQKILKMESPSLNMVIAADMSVCGVSAAIATAAACRAKKEELSLAIGLSLAFTVVMMVVMPAVIRATGMSSVLGGAWLGGTIDSTGAVAAAGGMLDDVALQVATTVKMIQNILIGAVAFGVAVYWVTYVERDPHGPRPQLREIWQRFPRFIFGFLGASLVCSWLSASGPWGDAVATGTLDVTKVLRGWCFCLAFVSIGLETNFRELAKYFAGGKPLVLYVCGQCLNLVLTLAMAWLMFEVVFPDAAASLTR